MNPQNYQDLISEFLEENKIVYSLSEYANAYAKSVPSACLEFSNKLASFENVEDFYQWLESLHRWLEIDLDWKVSLGEYDSELKTNDVLDHARFNLAAKLLEAIDRRNKIISPVRFKFNEFGFYE